LKPETRNEIEDEAERLLESARANRQACDDTPRVLGNLAFDLMYA